MQILRRTTPEPTPQSKLCGAPGTFGAPFALNDMGPVL
jgi:hypothetical protein